MSVALTIDQVKDETKTVTRRLGWTHLKPGQLFCAVKKGMGLKPGEKIERLKILRAVDVRHEPLRRMTDELEYGMEECVREGFPPPSSYCWPSEFVRFFCETHTGCRPETVITRIQFNYVYTVRDGEWVAAHSRGPYVYMLPAEIRILQWINAKYRFPM